MFVSGRLGAQDAAAKFHKNIFVKRFGNGVLTFVNYDIRLTRGAQDGLGIRAGIGGGTFNNVHTGEGEIIDAGIVTMPVGVNYLVGKRRSSFEVGIGITPIYVNADAVIVDNEFFTGKAWGAVGVLNLGYRFQPLRNGLMFRVDWTSVFGEGGFYGKFWGAYLGFGYK